MNKITFLFGSGADSDCNQNLKSGEVFSEILLKNSFSKEIKSLTKSNSKIFPLLHPNSTKVFLKTTEIHHEEMEGMDCFDNNDIITCLNYIGKGKNTTEDSIKYNTIRKICRKWYECIKTSNSTKDKKISEFFHKKAVLFDTLDEKFNSLRDIDFTKDAQRVISAYLNVFISIFLERYNVNKERFNWNYETIFKTMQEEKAKKINYEKNTYYSILKKYTLNCNIVTTNYTDLCELITEKDVIYLHGKLSWFEDLKHLTVYDCTNKEDYNTALLNEEHLIPFILIPSGVKPLICTKQIKQFSAFINSLYETNYLVVNGYAFNCEDNHINSIIGDWLRSNIKNKLYFFDYKPCRNSENSTEIQENIFSKMKWSEEFSTTVVYKKINPDLIFSINEQIICIKVCKNDSRKIFEDFLESYKKISENKSE